MQRVFASALCAVLIAATVTVAADEPQTPAGAAEHPAGTHATTSNAAAAAPLAPAGTQAPPKAEVNPVAVTAKRTHPHLQLKLSTDSLSRVLTDSGVEPVPEADAAVETVEVTAHRVEIEPIPQGIPALYYGIIHPSEAWRIFLPIQP
jgi:hypothetical protein